MIENKDAVGYAGPQLIYEDKSRKEIVNVTSVGVLVHTDRLEKGSHPCFLLVELTDESGCPWGIPAGRSEPGEVTSKDVAAREVFEETGLIIDPCRLKPFLLLDGKEKPVGECTFVSRRKMIFSYQVSWSEIGEIGTVAWVEGVFILTLKKVAERSEIGRLAIVDPYSLFQRDHPIIQGYYRWDVWHHIKAKLEGLRII